MNRPSSRGGASSAPDLPWGNSDPPYPWALGAAGVVFALYAVTLAPTTAFWDTSEYIATGHMLGIPHPPGNPLFVVLARAWELLLAPLGLSVAVRINLFSAFMSAAAHGLWFLVVHHILSYFSDDRRFRLVGAFAAVLVSATAFTVWNQSNVNEKVYTVSLLTIALLTWLAFRWQERLGEGRDDNLLVLMAFILALSVGNHLMAFLAAPAIGVFILLVNPRVLFNWKLYPAIAVAVVAGLSIHLFLPLRAGLSPVINEASPTCEGLQSALTSIVTYGKAGCVALSESLTRQQYLKPPLHPRLAPFFGAQVLNYFQYFDWQWARGVQGTDVLLADLRIPFTMVFAGLGVWGALEHARRDTPSFVYVLGLFGILSAALIYYLNFKYGYSIPEPTGDPAVHEVRERDYFFIVSFSVWGLWAGIGIAAIWQWLARDVLGSLAKASPVLLLALVPLIGNWGWATRSYDYAARDWAHNLLMSVEPYGVLFTNGDNDTFPLWYLQEVEGIRRDVTVIVTSYLNTPWYTKQLAQLTRPCPPGVSADDDPTRIICQREYRPTEAEYSPDAAAVAAAGRVPLVLDEPVRGPTRGILELTEAEIDSRAQRYVRVDQTQAVPMGDISAVLQEGMELFPWQTFGITILQTALGDRPIYFASSGNAASSLGVGDYLVRQGLAFKLHNGPLPESAPEGVVTIDPASALRPVTGPYIDVPRTRTLMDEVFIHRSDLPHWSHWPDRSTIGIPNYYAWGYYSLAQAALQAADTTSVLLLQQAGDSWQLLGG